MGEKSSSRVLPLGLAALLVVAVATIAYLWWQNAQLRNQAQTRAGESESAPRRVREGDRLPGFTARDTEGREVRILEPGTGNTLLFIYSPTCDRCEAGIPAWIKLANRLRKLRAPTQIVALSIADSYATVQHARTVKMPFPVVPFPNIELQAKYGATEVPLTVIVGEQGVVLSVWDKPLDEGEAADVIELICKECPERADL